MSDIEKLSGYPLDWFLAGRIDRSTCERLERIMQSYRTTTRYVIKAFLEALEEPVEERQIDTDYKFPTRPIEKLLYPSENKEPRPKDLRRPPKRLLR
jgi:hypothetical protein